MTLSFPRDLPPVSFGDVQFMLDRNDVSTPDTTGSADGVQLGFPLWKMMLEMRAQDDITAAKIQAWIESLDGQSNLFVGRDPRKLAPASCMTLVNGVRSVSWPAGAWTSGQVGTATSWSLDSTRRILTLNGLTNGFKMTTGDMVGFRWVNGFTKRHAVRAMEDVTATAGGSATFEVRPAVFATVPTGSGTNAYLDNPGCLMKLLASEVDEGTSDPDEQLTAKITARQVLIP